MIPFSHSDECVALMESASRMIADHYAEPSAADASLSSDSQRWQEFADLGWTAIIVGEQQGGLDGGPSMLSALAEALGPGVINEPLLSQCALSGYLMNALAGQGLAGALERWMSGELIVGLAAITRVEGPRIAADAVTLSDQGDAFRLNTARLRVVAGGSCNAWLVGVNTDSGAPALAWVDGGKTGVDVQPVPLIDGREASEVTFSNVPIEQTDVIPLDAAATDALGCAWLLHDLVLAAESLGIARRLVEITHEYLLTREQFGQTLADFQVLQHRLVDMQLVVVRFESLLVLARLKVDELGLTDAAPFIRQVATAIQTLGRDVGREAVQLHGGIGMTDELIVGRYLKRLTANELLVSLG